MQARHWIGTIFGEWVVPASCPPTVQRIIGQREICPDTGREHVQLVASFNRPTRLAGVQRLLECPGSHWEPTRSENAVDYVQKEDTRIEGSQFCVGSLPMRRNSKADWDEVKRMAQENRLNEIPSDIYVRYYGGLNRIAQDHLRPIAMERSGIVYWGRTGSGKSRRAWDEAGVEAFSKNPNTKWWDGYRGEEAVIIDEFRGKIDISHLLRWLDRYPVSVEVKGGTRALNAKKLWFTSNIHPSLWYPEIDSQTYDALLRRLTIEEMN